MLADRVRMILGGKKDMKTYKIQLSTTYANTTAYLNLQEDSVESIGNYLTTTPVEYEVSRYIPLALKSFSNGTPPIIHINGTMQNMISSVLPVVTNIGFSDGYGSSVGIYDLEAISTAIGIPIEDIKTLKFIISLD